VFHMRCSSPQARGLVGVSGKNESEANSCAPVVATRAAGSRQLKVAGNIQSSGKRGRPHPVIPMKRWAAYCLMTASLAAAVLLKGGVYPRQWVWSALGVSAAAVLAVTMGTNRAPSGKWGLGVMAVLLAWLGFQFTPFPPELVSRLTPEHWHAMAAARAATGQDPGAWVALSVASSATIERLLDVVPAMAAFVTAREMAWWWRDRIWIAVAPVVGIAWLESLLGFAQFYFMRIAGGETGSAAGTYVNRNHFAGLLEMAFPIAAVLAILTWRKSAAQFDPAPSHLGMGPALRIALLLAISACLLTGVVLSQSRMGFISTLAAAAFTMLIVPLSRGKTDEVGSGWRLGWGRVWRWVVPLALPILMLILLPTRELVLRFADMASTQELSKDDRVEIWHDTLQFIGAYKWTGCGLGAYEHGFYRFKAVAPINTVDFAHNDYLQILAELGIPGILLVGLLAGWIAARTLAVVLWRRDARNWELAVGLLASLATIGLHSLADFNLYIPANALAFAWLGGVAVSPGLKRS
jgi:O-antigen ligase